MGGDRVKVLITGITGFVGSHLAELCLQKSDVKVCGTVRTRSRLNNVSHLIPRLELHECDLRDPFSVHKVLAEVAPDYIFHLAAQSFVPASWKAPEETISTNILSQLNIFEGLRQLKLETRVQIACSSEQYGLVHSDELPINEDNPFRPLSPYGVSKVAQDLLGYQYHASYGLHIVRTRAFNHTGPRRGESFVTSSFCKQVAEIEAGRSLPVLRCGNLDARRDFTDVRDMARAYWLALEKGEPGEVYVVASGTAYLIREVLDTVLANTRCSIKVENVPELMRPSDVPVLLGDATKFRNLTGWAPQIPFAKTMSDLLDYWRMVIAEEAACKSLV
jgi:GDP-4-dehydro-6-deoxy-D-mannose reductase